MPFTIPEIYVGQVVSGDAVLTGGRVETISPAPIAKTPTYNPPIVRDSYPNWLIEKMDHPLFSYPIANDEKISPPVMSLPMPQLPNPNEKMVEVCRNAVHGGQPVKECSFEPARLYPCAPEPVCPTIVTNPPPLPDRVVTNPPPLPDRVVTNPPPLPDVVLRNLMAETIRRANIKAFDDIVSHRHGENYDDWDFFNMFKDQPIYDAVVTTYHLTYMGAIRGQVPVYPDELVNAFNPPRGVR